MDAGDKLRRYAWGDIPEYWIVRVDSDDWTNRVLEVRRKPVDEDYREAMTLEYGDAAFTLESEGLRHIARSAWTTSSANEATTFRKRSGPGG